MRSYLYLLSISLIYLSYSAYGKKFNINSKFHHFGEEIDQNFVSFDTYCQAPLPVPSQNTQNLTLQFVQILVRHGDRTPTWVLPIEVPWNCSLNSLNLPSEDFNTLEEQPKRLYRKTYLEGRESLLGNCMLGQLTETGLNQHLELGSYYRSLYVDEYQLLSNTLQHDEIWVRSTDVPRTIQSVSANLWGMYPPQERTDGLIDLVQINTMDNAMDDMFPNPNICPQLQVVYNQMLNSSAFINSTNYYEPLLQKLQTIFKSKNLPTSFPSVYGGLFDSLGARYCHGKELPNGIDSNVLQQIYDAISWQYQYWWLNEEAARLGSGELLGELYQSIEEFLETGGPLLKFYSGHDSTVGPLMGLLGYYNGWPPYASHMEIELWGSDTDHFVQVKYNGIVYQLPGCDDVMCEYSQFQTLMSDLIPQSIEQECEVSN